MTGSRAKHQPGQLSAEQQQIVTEHLHIARYAAGNFLRRSPMLDREEVTAEAVLGLVMGVERWPGYCQERGFDPGRADYLTAYLNRTVNGRIMDWARKEDHLTRSQRHVIKAIHAAEDGRARTEAEVSAATGLSAKEIRTARTADAMRSYPLDALLDLSSSGPEVHAAEPPDLSADTESSLVASEILSAAMGVLDVLPVMVQAVIGLRYFHDMRDDAAIGMILGLNEQAVSKVRREAVLDVHAAMSAVALGGKPPAFTAAQMAARFAPLLEIPPGFEPARWVTDSDQGRGVDAESPGKECARCGTWHPIDTYSWWNTRLGRRSSYCPDCDRKRQKEGYQRRRHREMAAA